MCADETGAWELGSFNSSLSHLAPKPPLAGTCQMRYRAQYSGLFLNSFFGIIP
jgi:hypothetical protein